MSQHIDGHRRSLLQILLATMAALLAAASSHAQIAKMHVHELETQPSSAVSVRLDRHGDTLPEGALARLGSRRLRHEGALGVAFSPNAKVLASVGESELRLWEVRDGKEFPWLLQISSAGVRIVRIRFSADNKDLFTTLSNGRVRQWDLETGKLVGQAMDLNLKAAAPFVLKATSADGTLQAGLDHDIIRIERAGNGRRLHLLPGHDGAVIALAVSADGKLLASAGTDRQVLLWDVARAELLHEWRDTKALCLALSADGKLLAVGEARDARRVGARGGIHLCDAKTGREIQHLPAHGDAVFALAFSPDGKRLLSAGSDNRARLWDTADWKELRQFAPRKPRDPEHTARPWAVAFSGDGTLMATCAGDDEEINLWPIDPAKEPVRIPRHWLLGFRPDSKTLLAQNHFGHLSVRDTSTGKELGYSKTVGWLPSPDGKVILVRGPQGRDPLLRDWRVGETLLTYQGQDGKSSAAVFAADGRSVFTASTLGTIVQWDVATSLQKVARDKAAALQRAETQRAAVLRDIHLEKLWSQLQGESDQEAASAVNAFVAMPGEALPYLKDRVQPFGSKEVSITRLIADLGNSRFVVRHEATRQLEKVGVHAEPELKAALEKPTSLEFKRRVEGLLEKVATEPTMILEQRAAVRTVTIMERLATAEATQVLRKLATGYPEAAVTRAAQAALDRLEEKGKK